MIHVFWIHLLFGVFPNVNATPKAATAVTIPAMTHDSEFDADVGGDFFLGTLLAGFSRGVTGAGLSTFSCLTASGVFLATLLAGFSRGVTGAGLSTVSGLAASDVFLKG